MATRVCLIPHRGGWKVAGRFSLKQIKAMRAAGAKMWDLPWTEEGEIKSGKSKNKK